MSTVTAQRMRQVCELILSSPIANADEKAEARIRLDEIERSPGAVFVRLDSSQPPGVTTMSKQTVTNPPTDIADPTERRRALIAKIKLQRPDFNPDDKSDAYLQGYAESMQPRDNKGVYKNGDALNSGAHDPKLDEADARLRASVIVAQHEQRVRNATAYCTTDAERAEAINRMDARDHEMALRAQQRDAKLASEKRLDANSDGLSPVVRAQVRGIEEMRKRASRPVDKWNDYGTRGNGGGDAA